jgi:hypothetical protein
MARLVALLIMFAFVFTNGPAVAMAMCQHNDARAHTAALASTVVAVSMAAQSEERAADAASKQGALSDAAAPLLAGYLLPPELLPPLLLLVEPVDHDPMRVLGLPDRSVSPLLEPPLA